MKTLVIYYSYTGHTREIATALAKSESADIMEVKAEKHPGKLKAYLAGCFAARRGKAWPIQPLDADLAAYERLILMSPVWASCPPPFVHAVLEQLPAGKIVSVKMIAASGKSGCKDRIEAVIKAKGCTMGSFEEIKA